jgi:AhpD family alkylhydroperoxidase
MRVRKRTAARVSDFYDSHPGQAPSDPLAPTLTTTQGIDTMSASKLITKATLAVAAAGFLAGVAMAQTPQTPTTSAAEATYKDIEATLGIVPSFMKAFPQSGIPGAWSEMKNLQLSDKTAVSPKNKQLISLAVAAQIPCAYCIHFHTVAAKANGASDEEVKEAVAMGAMTRHWSTVLNGMSIDLSTFKSEVATIMKIASERAGKSQ